MQKINQNVLYKYINLHKKYKNNLNIISYKYNIISILRFILFSILAILIYFLWQKSNLYLQTIFSLILLVFIYTLKVHRRISLKQKITQLLVKINQDEIDYLENKKNPFDSGKEFINSKHEYSFDLDIFGENSLFHNLNRTATFIGKKTLANLLLKKLTNEKILENQIAIKELNSKIDWKQNIYAIAKLNNENQEEYEKLIKWSKKSIKTKPKFLKIAILFIPTILILSLFLGIYFKIPVMIYLCLGLFCLNLFIFISQLKNIKNEIISGNQITTTLKKYALIFKKIEQENFNSKKLNDLKQNLNFEKDLVSSKIKKLSDLFSTLESIENGLATIIFNGLFLYHIHIYYLIINWKMKNSKLIEIWINTIGEFEGLNSLSNFSQNNLSFIFPEISNNHEIIFENLGHPLIRKDKRITNNIQFLDGNFTILTGSNMSGKSTFLRTLGINLVLANTGSCVCSEKAKINPMNLYVSMRQNDSLNDNESYFFAEIKRLKEIMDFIDHSKSFVLLDEILKGTNSEDKQTGSIEVIKKIISKNTMGIIATHDLEVCNTTFLYPNKLNNKCFEVEIINNELHFDYKLKNGICKNKSATFLMKKMNII